MTDKQLLAEVVNVAHAANALLLGSPAAIADCQRRREEAIRIAQAATEQAGEYDPTEDDGFTA